MRRSSFKKTEISRNFRKKKKKKSHFAKTIRFAIDIESRSLRSYHPRNHYRERIIGSTVSESVAASLIGTDATCYVCVTCQRPTKRGRSTRLFLLFFYFSLFLSSFQLPTIFRERAAIDRGSDCFLDGGRTSFRVGFQDFAYNSAARIYPRRSPGERKVLPHQAVAPSGGAPARALYIT